MRRKAQPYSDPYLAGIAIGVILLLAYVLVGRGLGASGAFSSLAAAGTAVVIGTAEAASSPATAPYLQTGIGSLFTDWLVLELIGVATGGALSAWFAGRFGCTFERGYGQSVEGRAYTAVAGGLLMGFGAKLARGCTSGQALSGGALLAAGSWIFILTCFAAGYAFAPLARRFWRTQ